jgi:hypothetical protein
MILHRGFRMGWISSVAGGGEESAGPPRGRLLWLHHPGPGGPGLSLPPVGCGAQSIVVPVVWAGF